jgi:hypothetical protein
LKDLKEIRATRERLARLDLPELPVLQDRVPFPSMELLGNNRSAACTPPGGAIQMVLVCAKP